MNKVNRAKGNINAGFYRSTHAFACKKSDSSHSHLSPSNSPFRSSPTSYYYKYQLISLSYYRSLSDPFVCSNADTLRSFFRQRYVKEIEGLEEVEMEREKEVSIRENDQLKFSDNIVEYLLPSSPPLSSHLIALAQSTKPLSCKGSYGYFEVYIISQGKKGGIGVGVACSNYTLEAQVGWQNGSWGYHGDDGSKYWFDHSHFSSQSSPDADQSNMQMMKGSCSDKYGPPFTVGDVIGCGVNNITKEMFFTKNGFMIGVAFSNLHNHLYPSVGLTSNGDKVYINQGQIPFLWDFDIENIYPNLPPSQLVVNTNKKEPKMRKRDANNLYEIEFDKIVSLHYHTHSKRKSKS